MLGRIDKYGNIIEIIGASYSEDPDVVTITQEQYIAFATTPRESDTFEQQKRKLENWFSKIYTYKEQKYRRLATLGLTDDDGVDAQSKLLLLYEEAERKRKRIQELELLLDTTNTVG